MVPDQVMTSHCCSLTSVQDPCSRSCPPALQPCPPNALQAINGGQAVTTQRLHPSQALLLCPQVFNTRPWSSPFRVSHWQTLRILPHSTSTGQLPPPKSRSCLTISCCPALQIINGDQAVLDAVQTTVSSGVLQLTTSGTGFQTSQPIQLGVNLPAAALTSVNLTGSAGVLVSDGFNVPALTLQNEGAGTLRAQGLTAQTLTLLNSG